MAYFPDFLGIMPGFYSGAFPYKGITRNVKIFRSFWKNGMTIISGISSIILSDS
jgi:hypothetical protein